MWGKDRRARLREKKELFADDFSDQIRFYSGIEGTVNVRVAVLTWTVIPDLFNFIRDLFQLQSPQQTKIK
jgi:hypothetical protein